MGKLILVLLCLVLTGCAGMADYTISLDNGYRIDRTSVHQIAIYGDEPMKTDEEGTYNYKYVPAKVTEVWWNEEYIIAKQILLTGSGEPSKRPTKKDFYYWVIDVKNHTTLGPLNEKDYKIETNKLDITEEISLKLLKKIK